MLPPHSTLRLWCTAGIVAFLCLWACSVHAATDAAAPVLVSLLESSPSVLSPPFGAQVTPVGSYTVGAATAPVSAVTFTSHSHHGQPVRIFGYLAMPPHKPGQKVAGLLILHGGGGRATVERAARGAASGFASLAIDLPGRGTGRWASRSTGPDMTVWNLFRTRPSLADNYLYHAVLAALRSVEFLRRQPEVDPERVGVYGMSWGGATALIAGSLDSRLAGVVDLFGSGYLRGECAWDGHLDKLDPAAVAAWQANFDPSAYVPRMKPPVLLVTGCNDGCYYLPRFLRTYETVGSNAHLLLRPNLDHRIDEPGDAMVWAWLRNVVRDGKPVSDLPSLKAVRVEYEAEGAKAVVSVAVGGKFAPVGVTVTYTTDPAGWTKKRWLEVPAREERAGRLTAHIPLGPSRAYAFATVCCPGGLRVSSPVHTFAKAVLNGERRVYHAPFVSAKGLELPLAELASDLGLDADAITGSACALLDDPGAVQPVQPRARMAEGKLYVAVDEMEGLAGASVTWAGGVPLLKTASAAASGPP